MEVDETSSQTQPIFKADVFLDLVGPGWQRRAFRLVRKKLLEDKTAKCSSGSKKEDLFFRDVCVASTKTISPKRFL